MGYCLNRLTEPVFIAVSKLLLTEFGIHYRLESCEAFLIECMLVQTQKVNVLVDPKGLFDFVLNFLQISSRQDPLKYSPVPFYQLRQRTALKVEEVAESYTILTILEVRLEPLNNGPLTIGKNPR